MGVRSRCCADDGTDRARQFSNITRLVVALRGWH